MGVVVFLAWPALLALMLAGFRIRYILPVLTFFTLFHIGRGLRNRTLRWNTKWVLGLLGSLGLVMALSRVAYKFFRFESGLSQYWDFGQFLQATYNLAHSGTPWVTFEGQPTDYFTLHRSLSAHAEAWLYGVLLSPLALWVWQTFWLFAPALILGMIAVDATRNFPSPLKEVIRTLTPATWVFSPVFSGQFLWSYNFHIAGVSALLLAIFLLERDNWRGWAFCLVIATLEKEEFGLYAAFFGAVMSAEAWRARERSKALLALSVALFGALGFAWFAWMPAEFNRASVYFGQESLGSVLTHSLLNPIETLRRWSQPRVFKLIFFLILISGIWLAPTRKGLRYALIPIPLILSYGLGSYEALTNIRNHYSLPILGFGLAALLTGTLRAKADLFSKGPFFRLSLTGMALVVFGFHNPVREFRHLYQHYRARAPELDRVSWLRYQKDIVVCCESQLCTHFAERPVLIEAKECMQTPGVLDGYRGRRLVWVFPRGEEKIRDFVLSSGTPTTAYSFFRVSAPTVID